jgi:hypothetical protein
VEAENARKKSARKSAELLSPTEKVHSTAIFAPRFDVCSHLLAIDGSVVESLLAGDTPTSWSESLRICVAIQLLNACLRVLWNTRSDF